MDDGEYTEFVNGVKSCLSSNDVVEYFEKNINVYETDIRMIVKKIKPLDQTLFSGIEADFNNRNKLSSYKNSDNMLAVADAIEKGMDAEKAAFFKERLWKYAKMIHVVTDKWMKKDDAGYAKWYHAVIANVQKDFEAKNSKNTV